MTPASAPELPCVTATCVRAVRRSPQDPRSWVGLLAPSLAKFDDIANARYANKRSVMGKVVECRKRHGFWGMRAQSRSAPPGAHRLGVVGVKAGCPFGHLVSTTAESKADKQAHRLVRRGPGTAGRQKGVSPIPCQAATCRCKRASRPNGAPPRRLLCTGNGSCRRDLPRGSQK